MRAFVTGQVGVDKGPYLEAVKTQAIQAGYDLEVCHVGRMMYQEAPDVPPGRILNIPISRLNSLRRAVFKEIIRAADRHEHLLVNTHATFRWRHGLFAAFDFDQIKALKADVYMTVLDNVESVHQRLVRDHDIDHTLKDIMVWREEELLATEILANITKGYGHFFMISRGRNVPTTQTIYRLMFEPHLRKVYPSFPMSHVMDLPDTLAEIEHLEMIVSLVPELPNGKPALSSGVERELHHAFEGGKEVYVVWACQATPSPFITETATRVFKSTEE